LTVKLCVSIPPRTIEETFVLIKKAEAQQADFIEVRLDWLKKHDHIAEIPNHSKIPLIATIKSNKNHGYFSGTETKRQKISIDAAKSGFDYVDVDLGTPNQIKLINKLKQTGTKVIVSFHDFKQTPSISELEKILKDEIALGSDVCKIVTTAKKIEDNLITLNFVSEASKRLKILCFAMGKLGKVSRLLSPFFGGLFTFASLDLQRKTAKGQLTIEEMNRVYEYLGLK
jgi:3-dehydroquinate dehydratase type I